MVKNTKLLNKFYDKKDFSKMSKTLSKTPKNKILNNMGKNTNMNNIISILFTILGAVYVLLGHKYLVDLKNNKCDCATGQKKYEKLRKLVLLIIGFYVFNLVLVILMKFAAVSGNTFLNNLFINKFSIFIFIPLFMLFVYFYRIYYSYEVYTFTKYVKNTCTCNNKKVGKFLQYYSVFDMITRATGAILFLGTMFFLVNMYRTINKM